MKKFTVRTVVAVTATWILFNLLLYMQLPAMVFFPTRELVSTPGDVGLTFKDVYLQSRNGNRIHGWYVPGKKSGKAVLFLHGNGGNISYRNDSLLIFNRLGLSVLIIDYQGYGSSEGEPSETALYEDARSAFDYLQQQRGFNNKNIVVFGRSLGGAVAAHLAAETQPGAVILESTFSSTRDMAQYYYPVLGRLVYLRHGFQTANQVRKINSPLLLMHSRDDEVIPFELGEKVYRAANKPKIFAEMIGDHNNGFLRSQPVYEQVLAKFLEIL